MVEGAEVEEGGVEGGEEDGEGALGGFGHCVSCMWWCDVLGCRAGLCVVGLRLVSCVVGSGRRGGSVHGEQPSSLDGIEPVADIMRRIILLVVIRTRSPDAVIYPTSAPVSSDELAMSRDETLSRDRTRMQPTSLQR